MPWQHHGVDLLDPDAATAGLADLHEVTHLVFAAYIERPTDPELIEVNDALLRNTLDALRAAGAPLQHVTLYQGGKAYGHHLGYLTTPAKERDPRLIAPHFYYTQEDLLRRAAAERGFTFTALRDGRPDVIAVDVDGDGIADEIMYDTNGDGYVDHREIVDNNGVVNATGGSSAAVSAEQYAAGEALRGQMAPEDALRVDHLGAEQPVPADAATTPPPADTAATRPPAAAAGAPVQPAEQPLAPGSTTANGGEILDLDGDGVSETVEVDTDGDGIGDYMALDTDGDGTFDVELHDTDGDGYYDTENVFGGGASDGMPV